MDYHKLPTRNPKNFGISSLGNCKSLWLNKKPLLTIGPDWACNVCIITTLILVLILFVLLICPLISLPVQLVGLGIMLLLCMSYTLTALLNPGIVICDAHEYNLATKSNNPYCQSCNMFLDIQADHCDDCGVCMAQIDHHCPLFGKCIAKGNLVTFYLFMLGLGLFFLYSVFLLALLFGSFFN